MLSSTLWWGYAGSGTSYAEERRYARQRGWRGLCGQVRSSQRDLPWWRAARPGGPSEGEMLAASPSWPLKASLRSHVDLTYPLEQAAESQEYNRAGHF